MNDDVEVQWRVSWFPPDGDKTKTGHEDLIRRIANRQAEWHPIVERREIVTGPWETVE